MVDSGGVSSTYPRGLCFAAEIPPIVNKLLVTVWQVKRHESEELEVSIIEDTVGNNGPREKKGE